MDSAEKGGIKTVLINEAQQIVYHVLREKPMYQNVTNGKLEVLIVGCGRIGMEFLKTISWCGQMIGYDLKIHVVDKRAHLIEQQFLWQCPGLKEPEYDICFYEVDVNTKAMEEVLECLDENVSYVIVALGNDQDNLNTSILLRRYFLMKQKRPMIGLVIQDVLKKKHVEQLKNERGGSYQLYSFGSEADLYGKRTVLNEEIESLAKKVHLAYNPQDQSLEEYYKIEYYKKSSRALALHIPYKIYSVSGKENLTYQELRCLVNDPNVREQLAKNEHNRWKAYLLSDGYRKASIKQVEQYEKEIHHHVYHLAKLHPALVDFEELELLSERIEEISGKMIDLKKSDYDIVGAIPEILKDNIGSDIDGRTED